MKIPSVHLLLVLAAIGSVARLSVPIEPPTGPLAYKPDTASIGWADHLQGEQAWQAACLQAEGLLRRTGKERATAFLQRALSFDPHGCGTKSAALRDWERVSYGIGTVIPDPESLTTDSEQPAISRIFDAMLAAEEGLLQRRSAEAYWIFGEREKALQRLRVSRNSYNKAYAPGTRARAEANEFLDQVQLRFQE